MKGRDTFPSTLAVASTPPGEERRSLGEHRPHGFRLSISEIRKVLRARIREWTLRARDIGLENESVERNSGAAPTLAPRGLVLA